MFPPEANDFFVKTVKDIINTRKQNPDACASRDIMDIILQAIEKVMSAVSINDIFCILKTQGTLIAQKEAMC